MDYQINTVIFGHLQLALTINPHINKSFSMQKPASSSTHPNSSIIHIDQYSSSNWIWTLDRSDRWCPRPPQTCPLLLIPQSTRRRRWRRRSAGFCSRKERLRKMMISKTKSMITSRLREPAWLCCVPIFWSAILQINQTTISSKFYNGLVDLFFCF